MEIYCIIDSFSALALLSKTNFFIFSPVYLKVTFFIFFFLLAGKCGAVCHSPSRDLRENSLQIWQ